MQKHAGLLPAAAADVFAARSAFKAGVLFRVNNTPAQKQLPAPHQQRPPVGR